MSRLFLARACLGIGYYAFPPETVPQNVDFTGERVSRPFLAHALCLEIGYYAFPPETVHPPQTRMHAHTHTHTHTHIHTQTHTHTQTGYEIGYYAFPPETVPQDVDFTGE